MTFYSILFTDCDSNKTTGIILLHNFIIDKSLMNFKNQLDMKFNTLFLTCCY